MHNQVRRCYICKKKHALSQSWRSWSTAKVDGKKIYYCDRGMDCIGCGTIHERTSFIKHKRHPKTGKEGWFCEKWVKSSPPSLDRIMDGLSPSEILSGVQYGFEDQKMFNEEANSKTWTETKRESEEKLREALE